MKGPKLSINTANVLSLDEGQDIHFFYFCKPAHAFKTPLVILCNVFQGFDRCRQEVDYLTKNFPVYIVSMPGLGESDQDGTGLNFENYADYLELFLNKLGVHKIQLKALSGVSPIGYWFGQKYPDRIEKLVIGGMSLELKNSTYHLMAQLKQSLNEKDITRFAQELVSNIFNFTHYGQDKSLRTWRHFVMKVLARANDNDAQKFLNQLTRWMENRLPIRGPSCPTLVLAGDKDHFMTPYENFLVANRCSQAQLGILQGQDHYCHVDHNRVITKVTSRFLLGKGLSRLMHFNLYVKKTYPETQRRLSPRYEINEAGFLDTGSGVGIPINIVDINTQGCQIHIPQFNFKGELGAMEVTLRIPSRQIDLPLIIFNEVKDGYYASIFKHRSISEIQRLEKIIQDNAQPL